MKRMSLVLLLTMVLTAFAVPAAALDGIGTEEAPFVITTQEELLLIGDFPEAHFVLGNDIVLEGAWIPLCTEAGSFNGTFDGQGHTISNLTVSGSYTNAGLIGNNTGTIKNLKVVTSETGVAPSSATNVGILCGISSGTIEGIEVSGLVVGKDGDYVGGMAGINSGTIFNGTVDAAVEALYGTLGGAVGENSGSIEKCYVNAEVSGATTTSSEPTAYLGGLSGTNSGTIMSCSVDYSIATKISGYSKTNLTTTNYYVTVYVGGVCGKSTNVITFCHAEGTISENATIDYTYIGGLVGEFSGEISNSNAVTERNLTSVTAKKGIAYSSGTGTVTNSFYDKTVSGCTDTGYGEPKSTLAMKMKATYLAAGWDFDTVWGIAADINDGYPYLLWEYPVAEEEPMTETVTSSEEGKLLFDIALEEASAGKWVQIALYGSNDLLVKNFKIPNTQHRSRLTVVLEEVTDAAYGKIFVWEGDESIAPVSVAEQIILQ